MGSTKVELVKDLESVKKLYPKKADLIDRIIANAKAGQYHDFESESATPKMDLHRDLLNVGLDGIDKKMQNGDYDDEKPSPEEEKQLMDLLKGK